MLCVGFLRGINVGGKNMVSMDELKNTFANFGCGNVVTVGNTGCVIYDSSECLFDAFVEKRLNKDFNMQIPYTTIPFAFYKRALEEAPEWWGGNDDWRHNVAFVLNDYPIGKILENIGKTDPSYERLYSKYGMIFWSSSKNNYQKTQYSKLPKKDCYKYLTIRSRSTAIKILEKAGKSWKN